MKPANLQLARGDFPESLWRNPAGLARSKILSPIYAERFKGVRRGGKSGVHNFWEFSFVMEGEMDLVMEGKTLHLAKDDSHLMPPNTAHEERAAESVDTIWIAFEMESPGARDKLANSVRSQELNAGAEKLWRFAQQKKELSGNELDGMALALYGHFRRLLESGVEGETELLADKAMRILNERFAENLALGEVAESLGVSEGHFFRAFKGRFHQTPLEHLTDLRMKQGCQLLLNTQMTLSGIAKSCGFQDPFYFSRAFKKWSGQSPSFYRENALKPQ